MKSFHSKGFTFIELMMVVAVVSILIAGSAREIVDFVLNNRAAAQVNELQSSLRIARHEAIKRNRSVTICQSADGLQCSGDWQNGWLVFADDNNDGVVNAGEKVLSSHGEMLYGNKLTFTADRVVYANNGTPRSGLSGTFIICDSRGADASTGLVVGPSGRPRIVTGEEMNRYYSNAENFEMACS
jgi:type IV fimbrial biogenesis protein FimT